jgi:transposase
VSVFDWNTGQPSILSKMHGADAPAKTTRSNTQQVEVAAKKPRVRDGRTIPIATRIDIDAVRAYRLAGNTWDRCAEHFGCSLKSLRRAMKKFHPGIYQIRVTPYTKHRNPPLPQIIAEINGGASQRSVAKKYAIPAGTLHGWVKAWRAREVQ